MLSVVISQVSGSVEVKSPYVEENIPKNCRKKQSKLVGGKCKTFYIKQLLYSANIQNFHDLLKITHEILKNHLLPDFFFFFPFWMKIRTNQQKPVGE